MKKRSDFNDDTESLIVSRSHSKVDTARASSDAEIDDDDEDRRIHSNSSPFNSMPHVFNLANCIIGVSILAMPFVFQQCGILLAVVMIMFCSILTKRITEISMLCFLMSSVIAFLVVIGDLGPHIAADYLELEAPTQRLRVLIIIFEAIPSLIEGKWSVHVVWWRSEGFLSCLPIVCMAMSCQTQLFCVIDCIKDASTSKVDTVVNNAINFCSAMYAAVGLFGYVAFYYKELHGDVLVELESTIFTQLLKLCFMLSIAFSIPLMLFPLRIAIFNLLLRPSGCELPAVSLHNSTFHILTVIILFSNSMVAIMIPNVEFILGLTGSLIGSIVSPILPCIIFICIGGRRGHSSLPYAKICLIIGIFMLLMSTWATLQSDRKSNVVEKPKPKDSIVDHPDLESLERLEEKVLDSNMNISQKLNDIAGLAAKGQQKEAERLIVEMKEQQKEQQELIKKQEKIVENLNKHMERHKLENDKTTNTTPKLQPAEEKKEEPKTEQKVENPNPEIPVAQKVETAEKSPMQEVPKTENEKQNEV
ncbi:hypothetical protein WR25_07335 [Diploscapter pachys]|uniref:Amino acid transporter transmembrane domain-containing protein n=1 Tax=Diploscapter pachys TaxID=2018661 RepID=A0A2A2KB16_9BILA|nr:hypothetical protein WR25_07335 [Diploscapter pachys]